MEASENHEKIIAKVVAVCTSEKQGTRKQPVPSIMLHSGYGVSGDAHAGTDRQVSLLGEESIEKVRRLELEVGPGDFAENITTSGINLCSLPIGTLLKIGAEALIRITQIGKECHAACEIRILTGTCVMPEEGVFAEVLSGGEVKAGDEIHIESA